MGRGWGVSLGEAVFTLAAIQLDRRAGQKTRLLVPGLQEARQLVQDLLAELGQPEEPDPKPEASGRLLVPAV
jgi:hypothetical protein